MNNSRYLRDHVEGYALQYAINKHGEDVNPPWFDFDPVHSPTNAVLALHSLNDMYIFRRKRRKIRIGDVEIELAEKPRTNEQYYIPRIGNLLDNDSFESYWWTDSEQDEFLHRSNLIVSTRGEAIVYACALNQFLENSMVE